MEFKLTLNKSELGMLLKLFNNRKYNVYYTILENNKDNETTVNVNSDLEDYDLLEDIMDKLDYVNIEHKIESKSFIEKVRNVKINAQGHCLAFDYNGKIIKEFCGEWKDLFKLILNKTDSDTVFGDERI